MAHRGNAMRQGGALVLLALLAPVSCGKAKGDSDGGSGGGGGGGGGGGVSNTITGPIDGITPAALLGNIGWTTIASVSSYAGSIAAGEDIFGPFEAGFSAMQDNNLAALGCSTGQGYVNGGIDTLTAEAMVAFECGVQLPRYENGNYVSLLDECGGHTQEYHFHERLSCLYLETGGHSTRVGETSDGTPIYGKWENYATGELPLLDACGGQFGVTPDSNGAVIYHYHVQGAPPFTVGCFGPAIGSDGSEQLVTIAQCRAVYSTCGDGTESVTTATGGTFEYDNYCPCFDGAASNVGTVELPVFQQAASSPLPSPPPPPPWCDVTPHNRKVCFLS